MIEGDCPIALKGYSHDDVVLGAWIDMARVSKEGVKLLMERECGTVAFCMLKEMSLGQIKASMNNGVLEIVRWRRLKARRAGGYCYSAGDR
ncbi:unnamed protein product [Dovyalis caffra]|uniref:Uncharacterized protein n=1 Tax=Dovyalis caffra TaxID=77055 RepID=A0AAV1SQP4_9ROSI|nr:unnamed protein product [Dovyalis caffra]